MEHVQMKFNWDHPSIDENHGHTQSEWADMSQGIRTIPQRYVHIK